MNANTWVSLVIFSVILAAFIWVLWKIHKDPKNANTEIGVSLMRLGITYNISALLLLQLLANIAEAGMIGSVQEENVNVASRMTGHMVVSFIGIVAALTWIKSFRELFAAFFIKGLHSGAKFAVVILSATIAVLTFIGSQAAPIVNMWSLANAVHQTTQLELFLLDFWQRLGGSEYAYLQELKRLGLPITYSSWGGLSNIMVSSVVLTGFHLLITVWDVALVLKLSITKASIGAAFNTDLEAEVSKQPDPPARTTSSSSQSQTSSTSANNARTTNSGNSSGTAAAFKYVDEILKFWNFPPDVNQRWATLILGTFDNKTATQQAEIAADLSSCHYKFSVFAEKGRGPQNESLKDLIDEFKASVKKWSGNRLNMPDMRPVPNG